MKYLGDYFHLQASFLIPIATNESNMHAWKEK